MAEATTKWHKLASLSAWQWRVLLTAPVVLLSTSIHLRLRGSRACLTKARLARPAGPDGAERLALARDTAYALGVAVRYGPWRPRCLLRSLALARFLGRRGIPCEVRIGLPSGRAPQAAGGRIDFSAHAWVECDGIVLNDREDIAAQYVPFDLSSRRP